MYLAVLLIIVAILVFYNELNSNMSIAEYMLLIIALIAIISAALDYMKFNTINEGFTSSGKNKDKFKNRKDKIKNDDEDTMILRSEESEDYL